MKRTIPLLGLWLAMVAMAWLFFLRRLPESIIEWLLLVLAGPPAFFLLSIASDALGTLLHSLPGIRHAETYAETRTSGKSISGLRILVYLVTTLVATGIIIVVSWLVRTYAS
jgi:hypothetical protein